jgi:hypothetical protein
VQCLSCIAGTSNLTNSYVLPAIPSAVCSFSDAPSTIQLRHRVKWASKYLKTDMAYLCAGDFVNWETRAGLAYSLRKQTEENKTFAFKLNTALSGHWKDGRSIVAYLHCSVFYINFDIQIAICYIIIYEIMCHVVLVMHTRLNVSNLSLNQKINRSKLRAIVNLMHSYPQSYIDVNPYIQINAVSSHCNPYTIFH